MTTPTTQNLLDAIDRLQADVETAREERDQAIHAIKLQRHELERLRRYDKGGKTPHLPFQCSQCGTRYITIDVADACYVGHNTTGEKP